MSPVSTTLGNSSQVDDDDVLLALSWYCKSNLPTKKGNCTFAKNMKKTLRFGNSAFVRAPIIHLHSNHNSAADVMRIKMLQNNHNIYIFNYLNQLKNSLTEQKFRKSCVLFLP